MIIITINYKLLVPAHILSLTPPHQYRNNAAQSTISVYQQLKDTKIAHFNCALNFTDFNIAGTVSIS